jgi:hypothetical protein
MCKKEIARSGLGFCQKKSAVSTGGLDGQYFILSKTRNMAMP